MSQSTVDLRPLIDDARAEHEALVAVLLDAPADDWSSATPAIGWDVRDQISHLAHFDEITTLALRDPARFERLRSDTIDDLEAYVTAVLARGRPLSGAQMLAWWHDAHTEMLDAFRASDPACRVPWFGPAMSQRSKLTARLMETWAHGQDVVDAVGGLRPATHRLRHIAHLGLLARPNSFRAHGLPVPDDAVHVALAAPDGDVWTWGDPSGPHRVEGAALDFALVVTRRRHVADTALVTTPGPAAEWMAIAQAFAGPPGAGRSSGQFAVSAPRRGLGSAATASQGSGR